MTHEETLAWWAIVLTVLGLVFHIPLSMVAHHYLPKVEDSFAARSREKLTERIAKLKHRLAQLNDPEYFLELEWNFREHLFVIMYLLGTGLALEAGSLFVATGAVPKNWFWDLPPRWPLSGHLPLVVVGFFLSAVYLAGRNMRLSASLKPSKRTKLRSDIQAQIDALRSKLDKFGT